MILQIFIGVFKCGESKYNISFWLGQFRHHVFHTFWKENPNFGKNAKRVENNVLSCHNEMFIRKFIPSGNGVERTVKIRVGSGIVGYVS